ncbi:MAG TPA: D-alanyl-D-alanine carboxypeptidase [Firmicutes bacterium]|nr:D-alanyl-D-alanine carboxypeptidase [Bacillota bacterium]
MQKRIFFLTACFLLSVLFPCFQAAALYRPAFEIQSSAAVLVNMDTDTIIYEKNPDKQQYPASLTKIMTAIIALEEIEDLDTVITMPRYIYDELFLGGASNAGINAGEEISIRDLLYALMVRSAGEAASALADYVGGGDIATFVQMMNDKAKEIGAVNTHFTNAHGLHDPDQVTTAYDMYLITKYALTVPYFQEIATAVSYDLRGQTIYHTCSLLQKSSQYYYPYAKGIKTGYTDEAGRNLVSMATKDGYNYLLITMGAPVYFPTGEMIQDNYSYTDAASLYDWAFSTFEFMQIADEGESVTEVPVTLSWDKDYTLLTPEKSISALLPNYVDRSAIQRELTVPESLEAPIEAGQVVGSMDLLVSGEVIGTVNLITEESIEQSKLLYIGAQIQEVVRTWWFRLILGILIFLVLAYIALMILHNRRKKKRNRYRAKIMQMQYQNRRRR